MRANRPRRNGMTLVELLISLGIASLLSVLVIVGAKAIMRSQGHAAAKEQLAMISAAIDRYAEFWPRWQTNGVVLADKGWPQYLPGRQFEVTVYQTRASFNDDLDFNIQNNLDVLGGNICLTFALTAESGKGPFLDLEDRSALIKDIGQIEPTLDPMLPARTGLGSSRRAELLVDPWGTPYRYFWVYRAAGGTEVSESGYLPVRSGLVGAPDFRKAIGYVVESAGPDRKFGNVWKLGGSTQQEINEAADNLVIP